MIVDIPMNKPGLGIPKLDTQDPARDGRAERGGDAERERRSSVFRPQSARKNNGHTPSDAALAIVSTKAGENDRSRENLLKKRFKLSLISVHFLQRSDRGA